MPQSSTKSSPVADLRNFDVDYLLAAARTDARRELGPSPSGDSGMILRFRQIVALSVAGSMFVSSTGAVAAGASTPPVQQIDPWAALSVMSSGAPAAALCGSAAVTAAAAQGASGCVLPAVDAPAPVAEEGPPAPVPVPPIAGPSSFDLGLS